MIHHSMAFLIVLHQNIKEKHREKNKKTRNKKPVLVNNPTESSKGPHKKICKGSLWCARLKRPSRNRLS